MRDYLETNTIKLLENNHHIKFILIGEGNYLSTMKIQLEKQEKAGQVKFLGYRDDVNQILPICDIFVLPTLHENLSCALLEASENGLPIIATNVGGNKDVVSNGINGLLVPVSNPEAIKEAIISLYDNDELRRQMSINTENILKTKFSESSVTDSIAKVYTKLLAQK